jgi:hypothetical protein
MEISSRCMVQQDDAFRLPRISEVVQMVVELAFTQLQVWHFQ